MESTDLLIKVITPTIMGGGFGQSDDIRPSEIKGLMRYWFRAVAGSFIVHFPEDKLKQDLKILKQFEESIFGSTQKKASFRIIIKNHKLKTGKLSHLPHKSWSKNNPLTAVLPDSHYNLEILIRNIPFGKVNVKEYKNFLKNLLKLSLFFGTGFRKNRFFGNMIIESEKVENIENLVNEIKTFVSNTSGLYEKKKTLLPAFPTFSFRNGKEKNFYIEKVLDNCHVNNWENFLENFYKGIIHKIEKDHSIRFFIDGGIRNFHKYSLLNFSYIDGSIYLSSFFHKNNGSLNNPKKYNDWKNGLNKIKTLINSGGLCTNGR